MSKLEKAIKAIGEVFDEFAGKDDKKSELSSAELKDLMKSQLSSPDFKDKLDPENIKEVMDALDKNRDGNVNFREFSQYVACLSRGYYSKTHGGKGERQKK